MEGDEIIDNNKIYNHNVRIEIKFESKGTSTDISQ